VTDGLHNTIYLWRLSDGRFLRTFDGHTSSLLDVALHPSGDIVADISIDKTARLWQVNDGSLIETLDSHGAHLPKCLAFSPDGVLLGIGFGYRIDMWEIMPGESNRQARRRYTAAGARIGPDCMAFSPDSALLAVAGSQNGVSLLNPEEGRFVREFSSSSRSYRSVAFSPDGKVLAAGGHPDVVDLWRVSDGKHLRCLKGNDTNPRCVAFHPGGEVLASGGERIVLWSVADGKCIGELRRTPRAAHGASINDLAFSRDGAYLACCGQRIHVWQRDDPPVSSAASTSSIKLSPRLDIAQALTVENSPVLIEGFQPTQGPPGTEVTITGRGFRHAESVAFSGIANRRLVEFTAVSDSEIRAVFQAEAESHDSQYAIEVCTPQGCAVTVPIGTSLVSERGASARSKMCLLVTGREISGGVHNRIFVARGGTFKGGVGNSVYLMGDATIQSEGVRNVVYHTPQHRSSLSGSPRTGSKRIEVPALYPCFVETLFLRED
jgi:hypothetical protein